MGRHRRSDHGARRRRRGCRIWDVPRIEDAYSPYAGRGFVPNLGWAIGSRNVQGLTRGDVQPVDLEGEKARVRD